MLPHVPNHQIKNFRVIKSNFYYRLVFYLHKRHDMRTETDKMEPSIIYSFLQGDIYAPNSNQRFHQKMIERKGKSPSRIERHVSWIRSHNKNQLQKIMITTLVAFETLALSLTGVGLLLISKGRAIDQKQGSQEQFIAFGALEILALSLTGIGLFFLLKGKAVYQKQVQEEQFVNFAKQKSPPPFSPSSLISPTFTFNHIHYFSIHDEIIWKKPILERNAKWKPVYFDGFPKNETPIQIKADGANLFVLDNQGHIHYKKILKEGCTTSTHYSFTDLSEKNNWKPNWFTLPIAKHIINIFSNNRANIDPNHKKWAVSHRGSFNRYFLDASQDRHYEKGGTTTLFLAEPDGKTIRILDPWLPPTADILIPLPQSSKHKFELLSLSASGSVLFVIGYETKQNCRGSQECSLKCYTKFTDIDVQGWTPWIPTNYSSCPPSKEKITIPLPGWKEHPLPSKSEGSVSDSIKIIQNGESQHSRVLVIQGQHSSGQPGYFYKKITANTWEFLPHHSLSAPLLSRQIESNQVSIQPSISDFQGNLHINKKKIEGVNIFLQNFGEGSYLSKVIIQEGEHQIQLLLNKRKGFINFLGFRDHFYELVLPQKEEIPTPMVHYTKKLFNSKTSLPIEVNMHSKQKISLLFHSVQLIFIQDLT